MYKIEKTFKGYSRVKEEGEKGKKGTREVGKIGKRKGTKKT